MIILFSLLAVVYLTITAGLVHRATERVLSVVHPGFSKATLIKFGAVLALAWPLVLLYAVGSSWADEIGDRL